MNSARPRTGAPATVTARRGAAVLAAVTANGRMAVLAGIAATLALAAFAAPGGAAPAASRIRVAASINDLASIAASVGGDQIEVIAIARPSSDPHRVEALPSYMVKVARSQVYLKVGLGLDQWADALIEGSRNRKLRIVDCSRGVAPLEKPAGKVDASMGDVHPDGNPHYWLDPRNGPQVARNIAAALAETDPANAARYRERAEAFAREAEQAFRRDSALAAGLPGRTILTYHRSWSYFAHAFGFEVIGTVEPVPGIPPTARHLAELLRLARAQRVTALIQEPYFPRDTGAFLKREAGVPMVTASPSCDAPAPGSYLAHFRSVLEAMRASAASGAR
jgi:zinc/manganese transport system substrate-binding protein